MSKNTKNKYYGNFFLCNKLDKGLTKVEGLYDTIVLDDPQETVNLKIPVFLNSTIEESEEVAFLFILRMLSKEVNDVYLPLVFRNRKLEKGDLFMEASVWNYSNATFPQCGTYSIELYVHGGTLKTDGMDKEQFTDILNKSDLLNRYLLHVDYKNK